MNHLNKIVFINSANIPYDEVRLDGNVHFSGTQGVGKSTVLRALLFFYNADKMRLGIQPGQKSFEEFYFPYSNSYIVYEVSAGQGAYSILLYRSQGKVVYRFIDAPYERAWFQEGENQVLSDWTAIRKKIDDNVDTTAKIETYEQYRNIIFGNTFDSGHRYDKYAIVHSKRYQNIPRSIQNVFLNSKLDADFVKNTIIQSMSEGENVIELGSYRKYVENFEREFDDIDKWFRKGSDGRIVVRVKADAIATVYRQVTAYDAGIGHCWKRLNYAVEAARNEIPVKENSIRESKDVLSKITDKIHDLEEGFKKEHEELLKKKNEAELRLRDIRNRRKNYEEKGIQEAIRRVGQKPVLDDQLVRKKDLLDALQSQQKDVVGRYKAIYSALDAEEKGIENIFAGQLNQFKDNLQTLRENAFRQMDSRRKASEGLHREWIMDFDKHMEENLAEQTRLEKLLGELNYKHPCGAEIDSCREEIREYEKREIQCKSERNAVEKEIAAIRREVELKRDQVEKELEAETASVRAEIENLEEQLAHTEGLLARLSGSLYEWLVRNKPGWEATIGRVVDAERVLYAEGLDPQLADADNGLFGVSVNLDALESRHHTPDDYHRMRGEQKAAVESKRQQLNALPEKRRQRLGQIDKAHASGLNGKMQELENLKMHLAEIPVRKKSANTRLRELQEKERRIVDDRRRQLTDSLNKIILKIDEERKKRQQQEDKHSHEVKSAETEFNQVCRRLEKALEAFVKKQDEEKTSRIDEIAARRKEFQRQEDDELRNNGADIAALEKCRGEIALISDELKEIEGLQSLVIGYNKDNEELFSREAEFKESLRIAKAKDDQLGQNYEDRKRKLSGQRDGESHRLKELERQLDVMNRGLEQYRQMCEVENIVPGDLFDDDVVEATSDSVDQLVIEMRGVVNGKRQKFDELKRAINSFNSHFGADNTFHFKAPADDDDYPRFAREIIEFIEHDKINEFRDRLSGHYNDILRSISREVGLLTANSSSVRTIIREVNEDFQKKNFAGVIRSIQLRAEDSSDKLMHLFMKIHEFTEEHGESMGDRNLFSNDDTDCVNKQVVEYLKSLMLQLRKEPGRKELTISDTFRLQFRVVENDNDTGWVERISNVGSDGTDILVKAMVNIMLINVFKTRATRKSGDFIIHCMMDEIGKLHPDNVKGILNFANVRNIYLINSSPMSYNADIYKYNYLLTKDSKSRTKIKRLVTVNYL